MAWVVSAAKAASVPATVLGVTGGDELVIAREGRVLVQVELARLRAARDACLVSIVGE